MGLFTNTKHEEAKKKILDEVSIINGNTREIAMSLDNQGLTIHNLTIISDRLIDSTNRKLKIVDLYNDFNNMQMQNFSVPWIDGKYMSLGMWDLAFCKVSQDFVNLIEEFCNNYK